MRALALALTLTAMASAAPRLDNVLEKMVPPGTTALAGIHLDQLRQTEMYRRLPPAVLEQLDRFPQPQRSIREVLFAGTPGGGVLLLRGTFSVKSDWKDAERRRHGKYDVWLSGRSAFCILDGTLAVAGEVPAVEAALDEWVSGTHTAAQPLLAKAGQVDPQSQVWGISADLAASFAGRIFPEQRGQVGPRGGNGFDFASALRSLGECWFEADLSSGIHMTIHGLAANEPAAASLRDTFRGLVGLGRLNMPEGQPELLRVWDGIVVDQKGRAVTLRADIPQNLADKLLDSLGPGGDTKNRRVL